MFKSSLKRDVVVILIIKLAVLIALKILWFDAPTIPENGSARVAEHLLAFPEGGPR